MTPNAAADSREATLVFKALTDPTRRKILRLLEDRPHNVNEIVGHFHLTQPTISRHLGVLRIAGLVEDHREGQNVIYTLRPETLYEILNDLFSQLPSCLPGPSPRAELRFAPRLEHLDHDLRTRRALTV